MLFRSPHLGQFQDQRCESCHSTGTFKMGGAYIHQELQTFFTGFHRAYACRDCHKQQRGRFPAGEGVAVRYKVGRTCQACHNK